MSDPIPFEPDDKELEHDLRRLVPSRLKVDFVDELARDFNRISMQRSHRVKARARWIVPAMAACLALFCGTVFWKIRDSRAASRAVPAGAAPESGLSGGAGSLASRLVPVSSEGVLLNASWGGIIDSPEGPQERYQLNFGDVHHWRDPDTATNIRIFSTHQETVEVPLQTH